MSRVENGSNHLNPDQWPSSTYQERAAYLWPQKHSRNNLPVSSFGCYSKNLGGAFLFSSALALAVGSQIRPVSDTSAGQPVEVQPITRNVVTLGPEVDINNVVVNQGEDVLSETLILESTDGQTVTRVGISISAEGSDSPVVTTQGPNINVNFPSKKP